MIDLAPEEEGRREFDAELEPTTNRPSDKSACESQLLSGL